MSIPKSAAIFVIVLVTTATVNGWPSGAPESTCDTLTPKHGQNQSKQPSSSPFHITQSQDRFEPGDRLKVVIRGPSGTSFKGLMVQAVDSNNNPIGLFEAGRGLKTIDKCSSVTHSDRRGKRAATLVWDAPESGPSGQVFFKATVVQRFSEFWTGLESAVNPNN